MKILLIILAILIIFLLIRYIMKRRTTLPLIENDQNTYDLKSIQILNKYFPQKDFSQNTNLEDLKSKLSIKSSYKKDLEAIVKSALHKIDVHYTFSINTNKPYSDVTTQKLTANEVLDYCIKNEFSRKKAIILNLLAINHPLIKEKLENDFTEEEYIESFYKLLPGFIERYFKKLNN